MATSGTGQPLSSAIPEYEVFVTHYHNLTQVFRVNTFATHFVSARIITMSEHDEISSLPPTGGVLRLLRSISAPLETGNTENFYEMLDIMQEHGNIHAKTLSGSMRSFILSSDPQLSSTSTTAGINYPEQPAGDVASIDFSDCSNVSEAFIHLTSELSKLLKQADFAALKRAFCSQMRTPGGVQLPDNLYQSIKGAERLDALLDVLAESKYWNWVDLRLLNVLIFSSGIRKAKTLVDEYKRLVFPKKLSEVLDQLPRSKDANRAYTTRVSSKIDIEPEKITVEVLSQYWLEIETLIMTIGSGTCALESVDQGCLEITWLLPIQCRLHAYKSALSNRHKFHQIYLQYLHIESHPPIYDSFTIQPAVLASLLHLPVPVASTPAEVINHFYCFLLDKLANNVICQIMHTLKLLNEEDLTKLNSEYQKNIFLLDCLLAANSTSIREFCQALNDTENCREIGAMLLSAIESISADGASTDADQQPAGVPPQSISSEDSLNSIEDCEVVPPKEFLDAKSIHIRFLELVAQLKEKLKKLSTQTLLQACHQLNANVSSNDHEHIPLFPSGFLDTLDGPEALLNRLSSTWRWNSYSSLRSILEACKCEEGLKLLDEFDLKINIHQPFESFPIPPPSSKMAPTSTSSHTVLSVRIDRPQTQPIPLQYIIEVSDILAKKFGISPHALQLLAVKADPLVLYWMVPKSVFLFVTSGLHDHLDYLKSQGVAEVAMYPNTVLFSNDNLNVGCFAFLSKKAEETISSIDGEKVLKHVYEQRDSLQAQYNKLKSSGQRLSDELKALQKKYANLYVDFEKKTFIHEAEIKMEEIMETLSDSISKFKKLAIYTKDKHDKAESEDKSPLVFTPPDVAVKVPTFLTKMEVFRVKLEETHKEWYQSVGSLNSNKELQIKQLKQESSELQSGLDIQSQAMEKLKNENKVVLKQYRQLRKKHEKDLAGFSQGAIADSLETDPGNIANCFQDVLDGIYQAKCSPCSSLPSPMYYAHATSDDNNIYIGGGVSPDKDAIHQMYRYTIQGDKWSILPIPSQYYSIPQVVNGRVTLFGGRDKKSGKVTSLVSTFHDEDNTWHTDYPAMLVARTRPAVVSHNNDVIVAGGKGEDTSVVLDDIEVLSTIDNNWVKLPVQLPKPMWGISATASMKSFHIVGYNGADDHCYNDAYTIAVDHVTYASAFDKQQSSEGLVKAQNPWVSLPDAPLWYSALVPTSSPPVIFGGENKNGEVVATAAIYEQATQLWRQIESVTLSTSVAYTTAALAGKNSIIVIGGCTDTKTTDAASSTSVTKVTKVEFEAVKSNT